MANEEMYRDSFLKVLLRDYSSVSEFLLSVLLIYFRLPTYIITVSAKSPAYRT